MRLGSEWVGDCEGRVVGEEVKGRGRREGEEPGEMGELGLGGVGSGGS